MSDRGIFEKATSCQNSLSGLVAGAGKNKVLSETVRARDVEPLQQRFGQWAGNLGALQPASSTLSLEYRLRKSPLVRDAVLKLLCDLLDSLESVTDIATGRRSNRTAGPLIDSDMDVAEYGLSSSDSDSDSHFDCDLASGSCIQTSHSATSEIDELMSAVKSGIDSLFRTSMFIRKHAQKDKRQRASATRPFDNRADVMYIKDRYPLVTAGNESLLARLGEANARRRQYFKYCRDHNDRLSRSPREEGDAGWHGYQASPATRPVELKIAPTRSVLSGQTKPSILADTEATEFIGDHLGNTQLVFNPADVQSSRSVVSFATTVAGTPEDNLAFPDLPVEAENNPTFLCPYCFTVVALKGKDRTQQWRSVDPCNPPWPDRINIF